MTNIISKLTLRHLSENKKRTVVTVLGVAASTALITSMILGITSFFVFLGNLSGTIAGRWQLVSENMTGVSLFSVLSIFSVKLMLSIYSISLF